MTTQLSLHRFENALVKFKEKTKNYPWANTLKHRDHVAEEALRLIKWVPSELHDQARDIAGRIIL